MALALRCQLDHCFKSNAGPVYNWMVDRLGLPDAVYNRTIVCSDVVSCGSENQLNQMARLTDLELDVKEPQWM